MIIILYSVFVFVTWLENSKTTYRINIHGHNNEPSEACMTTMQRIIKVQAAEYVDLYIHI